MDYVTIKVRTMTSVTISVFRSVNPKARPVLRQDWPNCELNGHWGGGSIERSWCEDSGLPL